MSLLENFVSPDSMDIDDDPISKDMFSFLSLIIFAISFIDFLGIIPDIISSDPSLTIWFAIASLWASVATPVILVSSITRYKPFR